MKLPPPATEFKAPANMAATKMTTALKGVMSKLIQISTRDKEYNANARTTESTKKGYTTIIIQQGEA